MACSCSSARHLALSYQRRALRGAVGQQLQLQAGHRYELRCSAPVRVTLGQADPSVADLILTADGVPLDFIADVGTITITNATGTDAFVYMRGEHR
jgi:hypothetical protein